MCALFVRDRSSKVAVLARRVLQCPLLGVLLGEVRRRAIKHPLVQLVQLFLESLMLLCIRRDLLHLGLEVCLLCLEGFNARKMALLTLQGSPVLLLLFLLHRRDALFTRAGVLQLHHEAFACAVLDVLPVCEFLLPAVSGWASSETGSS